MKAIVLNQPHGDLVLQDVAQPTPSTGQILVKIGAIGLNPVDWKQRAYNFAIPQYPAILGCDFSGTVEAIGPDVTKFIVGDAVYGFNPLGRTGFGTHAQYTLAYADIAVKKPPTLTSEQAAAISLPSLTAATGLFELLGLDVPHATVDTPARGQNLLVWGASSNVGAYAVQLAKLSGYSVTGVCSARNFEYVKSLGADHVVDYNSPSVVDDLKALGPFQYAYDVIGDASANLAAQVLVSGGHLVSPSISQGYKPPRDDVRADRVFTGGAYLAGGEALQRLALYAESIRDLLAVGKLKPTPIKRLEGLASVVQGLELLEQGKVSAAKLVVVPEQ